MDFTILAIIFQIRFGGLNDLVKFMKAKSGWWIWRFWRPSVKFDKAKSGRRIWRFRRILAKFVEAKSTWGVDDFAERQLVEMVGVVWSRPSVHRSTKRTDLIFSPIVKTFWSRCQFSFSFIIITSLHEFVPIILLTGSNRGSRYLKKTTFHQHISTKPSAAEQMSTRIKLSYILLITKSALVIKKMPSVSLSNSAQYVIN